MKLAVLWGFIFGVCAFIVDVFLPGCVEIFFDILAAFLAGMVVVRKVHPPSRSHGAGLGLVAGLSCGLVITLTDMALAALLAVGCGYKDQIPWVKLPDISFLNPIFGNLLAAILVLFLCMGVIKMAAVLIAGLLSGWIFSTKIPLPPRERAG